jgi:DNA-binding transcriptional regulator GbsR (MarR family)
VVSSVTDTISTYSSPAKAQSQLRRFEHRGSAARTRMEREVRKTRTRVERELRERRRELDQQRERLTKEVTSRVEQTQSQIEKTQSQIEDALRTRLQEGADLASRVQERVLSLV